MLKLATPFTPVLAVYDLPLTVNVSFLPVFKYIFPSNGFLIVFKATVTVLVLAEVLNAILFAMILVGFLTTVNLVEAIGEALYSSSP